MTRQPMGIGKKPPCYDDPCVDWLRTLSKAALIDCVCDLMRTDGEGGADSPVSVARARNRLDPVLRMRGDRGAL